MNDHNNKEIISGFCEGLIFPFVVLLIFQFSFLITLVENTFHLSGSSIIANTQNVVYSEIDLAMGTLSCGVYLVQPFISGATSLKNALGYFLGAGTVLYFFVTQINTILPAIQPKVIEDVTLVGVGVLLKIICIIWNSQKMKKRNRQQYEDNVW